MRLNRRCAHLLPRPASMPHSRTSDKSGPRARPAPRRRGRSIAAGLLLACLALPLAVLFVAPVQAQAGGNFVDIPAGHNGSTRFRFFVNFNSSQSGVPDVTATNATVSVTALGLHNSYFQIYVTPSSDASVRITVPGIGTRTVHGPASDARLKDMWFESQIRRRVSLLTPGGNRFNPNLQNYRVDGHTSVAMEPINSNATIRVMGRYSNADGKFTLSSRSGGEKYLSVNFGSDDDQRDRVLTVRVTSANGQQTRDYDLQFGGGSRSCYGELISPNVPEYFTELDTLTVTATGGSVDSGPGTLSHDLRGYTVYVTESTTHVRVSASGKHADSKVSIWTGTRNAALPRPARLRNILWAAIKVRTDLDDRCYESWHSLKVVKLPLPGQGSSSGGHHKAVGYPLTAQLLGMPTSHDGLAFTFRILFSEDVDIEPEEMRDHALQVTGGTVTNAARVEGRSDLWELTVEPSGTALVGITVPLTSACTEEGALCTSDGRALSSKVLRRKLPYAGSGTWSSRAPSNPSTLTAAFENAPASHDGSSTITVELAFSEAVFDGTESLDKNRAIRDALQVTGGTVTGGRRANSGAYDRWILWIRPSGNGAVTVRLPATTGGCGAAGAICTPEGQRLSEPVTATIPGPPGLSVADAEVQEGPNATLDFTVTLSRAVSRTVTVDYATSGDTATAGSDFTAASGMLTFAAGDTSKTVSVAVLDDTVDDDGETLMLTLSNASGAYIADNQATGTITNTDPMPRAWIARFGRTVAEQVSAALGERLRGAPGDRVTLGGRRVDLGGGLLPGKDGDSALLLPKSEPGHALPAPMRDYGEGVGRNFPEKEQEVSLRELMLASSFHLASSRDTGSDSRWSVWGRGTRSNFEGREGELALEGDVTTAMLGLDLERDNWLVGMALARSSGDGSFRAGGSCASGCAGEVESALTGLYPYARYRVSERLSLWGVLGHGQGDLTLSPEGANAMETDIEMSMAAAGARGVVLPAAKTGGFELALRADLLATSTSSDAAAGIAEAEAETSRIRLLLEGSRALRFGEGGVLTPSLELGLRYDGGDAETGAGAELGGALRYAAKRLTLELSARGLIAHAESDYEEWGVSASIRLSPGDEGRGLSMNLASAWGAAAGGAERLWTQTYGLSPGSFDPGARLDAEIGYGLAAYRGLLTPYTGLSYSEGGGVWRAGTRWSLGSAFELEIEASLREPAGGEDTESGVLLRGSKRW